MSKRNPDMMTKDDYIKRAKANKRPLQIDLTGWLLCIGLAFGSAGMYIFILSIINDLFNK